MSNDTFKIKRNKSMIYKVNKNTVEKTGMVCKYTSIHPFILYLLFLLFLYFLFRIVFILILQKLQYYTNYILSM